MKMKPEYYIGIDMIDEEHKQLLNMQMSIWTAAWWVYTG